MTVLKKLFARSFENLYHALNTKKTCSMVAAPDLFEQTQYTIDAFYEYARPFFDHPCDFFIPFKTVDEVRFREGRHSNAPPPESATYREMVFDSPITTPWPENNVVPFKWFDSGEASTVLLFAPGWGRSSQSFEQEMCERLCQNGVDAALLMKPFHQARTPAGSFSGEYFISANLFLTIQNFRQFVAEIRLVTQFLRSRYRRVGIIGMSSGGFQAGLAANCEPFEFFFPFITGCRLASITWHGLITRYVRRDLEARGISESDLARVWSITDLAVVGRHCRARTIKQYIALYDTVIPTQNQRDLWEVYGRPPYRELEASHYSTYFMRNEVIDDILGVIASEEAKEAVSRTD